MTLASSKRRTFLAQNRIIIITMRHLRFGLFSCVGLLLLASAAAAQTINIRDLRLGFPSGDQDRYKVGAWAPVIANLQSEGGPFEGILRVETADGDGIWTRSTPLAISLAAGQAQTFVRYIKIGSKYGEIRAHVKGKLADKPAEAAHSYEPERRSLGLGHDGTLILCIGRPHGLEEPTEEEKTPSGPTLLKYNWRIATQTNVSLLPEHWFGYEGVDIVVLPTSELGPIQLLMRDEKRRRALIQWVQQGGHLIVSVSRNRAFVADPNRFLLEPLLPAAVDGGRPVVLKRVTTISEMIAERIEGVKAAPFRHRGKVGDLEEDLPDVEMARLGWPPRPAGRSIRFEPSAEVPVIVQGPHGLGRVTLIAFDIDAPPFATWENRKDFWTVLLDLRAKEVRAEGALVVGAGLHDQDLAVRFLNRLEQYETAPVISFGWVAFLIFAYLALVGPLEYLLLKYVARRMTWTWLTFPLLIVAVSAGVYQSAHRLKGNELRVNKVDVVDLDLENRTAFGSTWFTLFSPRLAHYDLGIAPAAFGDSAEGLNVSWMGRPGSGMRGLERRQSPTLFRRSYQYADEGEGLRGLPISVWSVKALTARWQMPLPPIALLQHDLEKAGALEHRLTISPQFPWTLKHCRLFYNDVGRELGTISPGKTVVLPTNTVTMSTMLGDYFGTKVRTVNDLVAEIMFQGALPPRQRALNEHLDYLDQGWRAGWGAPEAMLIGYLDAEDGPISQVNQGKLAGCRIAPLEPALTGTMTQNTVVRIIFPVRK